MDHSSHGLSYKLLVAIWLIGGVLPFLLGVGAVALIVWLALLTAVGLMVAILVQVADPPRRRHRH